MKRKLEKTDIKLIIIGIIYGLSMPILMYVFLGTCFMFGFWM